MKKELLFFLVLAFITSCEKDDTLIVNSSTNTSTTVSTNPTEPSFWGLGETTPVPDVLFEAFLVEKSLDDKVDGKLDTRKAMSYTGHINYKVFANGMQTEMKSVEGLEAFVNITGLEIVGCKITSINLKNQTKLIQIAIANTTLTSIDFSPCTELEEIMCQNSTDYRDQNLNLVYGKTLGLTSIDISKNLKLKKIWLWANRFKSINVSHLKSLNVLWVNDNDYLEQVEASYVPALYQIIANNLPSLNYINIKGTNLRQWDPSNPTIKASTPDYFNLDNCPTLKKAYVQNVNMVSEYAINHPGFWVKGSQTEYVEAP